MKIFEKNDVFYNTIAGSPSYKVVFYNGNIIVNDQINERNKTSSSINLFEINVGLTGTYAENFTKNNINFFGTYEITGSASYRPEIKRNFIYKSNLASNFAFDEQYTLYNTVKKIYALQNSFIKYSLDNDKSKITEYFDTSLNNGSTIPASTAVKGATYSPYAAPTRFLRPLRNTNLIEIPQAFYGIKIQPGTLNLKIYVTGTLVAEACDKYKNTKIIQTSSSYNSALVNNEIGMVLYDEGVIILTGSSQLATQSEYYIQPVSSTTYANSVLTNPAVLDSLKWIHFGSHKVTTTNVATSTPIVSASFELSFNGSTQKDVLTMFCSADKNKLTWSNNRTFLSGGQTNKLILGETSSINVNGTTYVAPSSSFFIPSNGYYFENDQIIIKNTLSSSYTNYTPPYKSQVFISEIGIYNEDGDLIAIGKLANPLRKTPELDYTIKLKLDI